MILVGLALAADGGPSARQRLEDALLARALGDHDLCRSRLMTLANSLAADDPVRGWSLFWLATMRMEWGEPQAARETLRECIRTGPTREVCEDLLVRLELEGAAMRAVPTVWDFQGPHGVVLPEQGRMAVEDGELVWTHVRDPSSPGTLIFGVDLPPDTPPATFTLTIRSVDRESWVGVVFVDTRGNVLPASEGVRRLPADTPITLNLPVDGQRGPLPGTLERVLVRDVSGLSDASGASSTLRFAEIALR